MPARFRLHAAPATFVSLAVILALATVGVVVLGGGKAAAVQQVSCGDTITTDATLHHNLVNCPNNGLLIGADNVTLDLNYHTIDGDGTPFSGCHPRKEVCDVGVVNDGHDAVTVVHGSVRQFEGGVGIGGDRNRLLGVSLLRGTASTASGCSAPTGPWCKTAPETGRRALVTRWGCSCSNRITIGSLIAPSGTTSVESSPLSNTNTLIRGNLFSRNRVDGFFMEGGDGFRITHNRAVRNQESGIALGPGSDNVITRNHVSRAGDGIAVAKGHGNLIAHNVVAHTDNGISLGVNGAGPLSGARSVVRRNLVRDSRKDGFFVRNKDRHSRLKGNVAKRSGDDGFDVESRSAKLSNNRAVRNHDLGIEAVRGVIDGGGNRASGNGDPRQCIHIACR